MSGCQLVTHAPLIPFDEWNTTRREVYKGGPVRPRPNGIACPECGAELIDSSPTTELLSNPPRKAVRCQCGFVGTRIA